MNMKLKTKMAAALFAASILTMPSTAFADEGKPGKMYWNTKESEVSALLLAGNSVCEGSNWIYTCYSFTRATQELQIQYTSRQRKGVGTNITSVRYVRATNEGYVERDEAGNLITTLSKTAAVENGRARIYQVFAAAANGLGGAIAGPLVCEAVGGCGGGGPAAVSISSSGSVAEAIQQNSIKFNATSGCATGGPCYRPD